MAISAKDIEEIYTKILKANNDFSNLTTKQRLTLASEAYEAAHFLMQQTDFTKVSKEENLKMLKEFSGFIKKLNDFLSNVNNQQGRVIEKSSEETTIKNAVRQVQIKVSSLPGRKRKVKSKENSELKARLAVINDYVNQVEASKTVIQEINQPIKSEQSEILAKQTMAGLREEIKKYNFLLGFYPESEANSAIRKNLHERISTVENILKEKTAKDINEAKSLQELKAVAERLGSASSNTLLSESGFNKKAKNLLTNSFVNLSLDPSTNFKKLVEDQNLYQEIINKQERPLGLEVSFNEKRERLLSEAIKNIEGQFNAQTDIRTKSDIYFDFTQQIQLLENIVIEGEKGGLNLAKEKLQVGLEAEIKKQINSINEIVFQNKDNNLMDFLKSDMLPNINFAAKLINKESLNNDLKKALKENIRITPEEIISVVENIQKDENLKPVEKIQLLAQLMGNYHEIFLTVPENILYKYQQINNELTKNIADTLFDNNQYLLKNVLDVEQLTQPKASKSFQNPESGVAIYSDFNNKLSLSILTSFLRCRNMQSAVLLAKQWIEIAAQALYKGDLQTVASIWGALSNSSVGKIIESIKAEKDADNKDSFYSNLYKKIASVVENNSIENVLRDIMSAHSSKVVIPNIVKTLSEIITLEETGGQKEEIRKNEIKVQLKNLQDKITDPIIKDKVHLLEDLFDSISNGKDIDDKKAKGVSEIVYTTEQNKNNIAVSRNSNNQEVFSDVIKLSGFLKELDQLSQKVDSASTSEEKAQAKQDKIEFLKKEDETKLSSMLEGKFFNQSLLNNYVEKENKRIEERIATEQSSSQTASSVAEKQELSIDIPQAKIDEKSNANIVEKNSSQPAQSVDTDIASRFEDNITPLKESTEADYIEPSDDDLQHQGYNSGFMGLEDDEPLDEEGLLNNDEFALQEESEQTQEKINNTEKVNEFEKTFKSLNESDNEPEANNKKPAFLTETDYLDDRKLSEDQRKFRDQIIQIRLLHALKNELKPLKGGKNLFKTADKNSSSLSINTYIKENIFLPDVRSEKPLIEAVKLMQAKIGQKNNKSTLSTNEINNIKIMLNNISVINEMIKNINPQHNFTDEKDFSKNIKELLEKYPAIAEPKVSNESVQATASTHDSSKPADQIVSDKENVSPDLEKKKDKFSNKEKAQEVFASINAFLKKTADIVSTAIVNAKDKVMPTNNKQEKIDDKNVELEDKKNPVNFVDNIKNILLRNAIKENKNENIKGIKFTDEEVNRINALFVNLHIENFTSTKADFYNILSSKLPGKLDDYYILIAAVKKPFTAAFILNASPPVYNETQEKYNKIINSKNPDPANIAENKSEILKKIEDINNVSSEIKVIETKLMDYIDRASEAQKFLEEKKSFGELDIVNKHLSDAETSLEKVRQNLKSANNDIENLQKMKENLSTKKETINESIKQQLKETKRELESSEDKKEQANSLTVSPAQMNETANSHLKEITWNFDGDKLHKDESTQENSIAKIIQQGEKFTYKPEQEQGLDEKQEDKLIKAMVDKAIEELKPAKTSDLKFTGDEKLQAKAIEFANQNNIFKKLKAKENNNADLTISSENKPQLETKFNHNNH